jgi:hypothetical protein
LGSEPDEKGVVRAFGGGMIISGDLSAGWNKELSGLKLNELALRLNASKSSSSCKVLEKVAFEAVMGVLGVLV